MTDGDCLVMFDGFGDGHFADQDKEDVVVSLALFDESCPRCVLFELDHIPMRPGIRRHHSYRLAASAPLILNCPDRDSAFGRRSLYVVQRQLRLILVVEILHPPARKVDRRGPEDRGDRRLPMAAVAVDAVLVDVVAEVDKKIDVLGGDGAVRAGGLVRKPRARCDLSSAELQEHIERKTFPGNGITQAAIKLRT
jgi:hypothetical protein